MFSYSWIILLSMEQEHGVGSNEDIKETTEKVGNYVLARGVLIYTCWVNVRFNKKKMKNFRTDKDVSVVQHPDKPSGHQIDILWSIVINR